MNSHIFVESMYFNPSCLYFLMFNCCDFGKRALFRALSLCFFVTPVLPENSLLSQRTEGPQAHPEPDSDRSRPVLQGPMVPSGG